MSSVKILRHDFGTFYHFRGLTKMFGNWLKLNMICNKSTYSEINCFFLHLISVYTIVFILTENLTRAIAFMFSTLTSIGPWCGLYEAS